MCACVWVGSCVLQRYADVLPSLAFHLILLKDAAVRATFHQQQQHKLHSNYSSVRNGRTTNRALGMPHAPRLMSSPLRMPVRHTLCQLASRRRWRINDLNAECNRHFLVALRSARITPAPPPPSAGRGQQKACPTRCRNA